MPDRNRPIEAQLADAEQAADQDPTASPPAIPEPGNGVEVAPPPRTPRTVVDTLNAATPQLRKALPMSFSGGVERFSRIIQTALRMNPDLERCTPNSVIGAAFQAAQLGLTPGVLGEAWILPYRNNKTGESEATFQIGWKGYVALAYRSGIILSGDTVHELDTFHYSKGLEPTLVHIPAEGDRGKSVYWYAVARRLEDGRALDFAVLDRAAVQKRRDVSRSKDSPAWTRWWDEMALGKAARAVCRFLPLTVEAMTALASDETVRTEIRGQADEYTFDSSIEIEP